MNREIEDGMGFSGLVPTKAEREADRRHEREVRAHFVQVDTLRARIRELESKLLAAEARSVALESVIVTYQLAAVATQDREAEHG